MAGRDDPRCLHATRTRPGQGKDSLQIQHGLAPSSTAPAWPQLVDVPDGEGSSGTSITQRRQTLGFTPRSFSACCRFLMPLVCLFELQRLPPLVRSDLAAAAFVALPWVVIAWSNCASSAEQRSASFWLCSVGLVLVVGVVVVVESARAAVERRMAARPVAMLVRMIIAVLLILLSIPI